MRPTKKIVLLVAIYLTLFTLLASITEQVSKKIIKTMKKIAISLSMVLAITGCSMKHRLPPQRPSSHAQIKLAEAANSVSRSLRELARVQREATPPAKGAKLPDPARLGIRQAATIDWSGPVEPLLKHISSAIHYRFRILGKEPAVPVIVTLTAKRAPVASILRDVDFQAGHQGRVMVYPKSRVIELRYEQV